jgi:hypothetical protein
MIVGMKKRMLISGLWFISMWGIGGAMNVFLDVPRALMLVPAIAVAAAWWIGLARYELTIENRRSPDATANRRTASMPSAALQASK